jgi:hypothetical protein
MGERKGRGIGGCWEANVDDVNLMEESMKLVNPVREVFFVISVFFISNLLGPSWESVGSMVHARYMNKGCCLILTSPPALVSTGG